MLERGSGRIIVIASDSAKKGEAGLAVYNASKHAVLGLVRGLAMEVGAMGIIVNAVCPGFVWTKMAQDAAPQLAEIYGIPPEGMDEFLKSLDPLKRIATPEEVADVVVFLAMTTGGGVMTGQGLCMATTTLS
jgi:NAD(P)-dependent dehydrogenase (short-subunit alcohol dehydrogenase family)